MELSKSSVFFDREKHQYWLNGVELMGITTMLHNQLFPSMYNGIDPKVLDNAARRGTAIHESCERADILGFEGDTKEAMNYVAKRAELGLDHIASEYLVSDNEHFASCIDKVYKVSENEVILGDIKTTYTLHHDYVMWQLSIYAYLFELCNPEIKVAGLYGIWLRDDKCEFVTMPRVSNDLVKDLMEKEVSGVPFVVPYNLPTQYAEIEMTIANLYQRKMEVEKEIKLFEAKMKEEMDKANVTKWESAKLVITRRADYSRKSLDSKALKEAHPDIYNEFEKETICKGGVTIKIKD